MPQGDSQSEVEQNQNTVNITMGKIKSLLVVVPVLATLLVGCASNTKSLGKVGATEFYRVKSSTFSGPNFSALVSKTDEGVRIEQVFGGPGLGPSTISAIGTVGGSAVLGISFPKNVGDNVNVAGGSANATGGRSYSIDQSRTVNSASGGAGGNASANNHNNNSSASSASSSSTASSTATSSATGHTHPDSPGNGGTPGDGGQNGNGNGNGGHP